MCWSGEGILPPGLCSCKNGKERVGMGREKCLQDRYTSVRFPEFGNQQEHLNCPCCLH